MVVVVPRRGGEFLARWRLVVLVPSKAIHLHVDSTQFGNDVLAFGQRFDIRPPLREIFLARAFIGTDAERAAEMVQDNRGAGEGPR